MAKLEHNKMNRNAPKPPLAHPRGQRAICASAEHEEDAHANEWKFSYRIG